MEFIKTEDLDIIEERTLANYDIWGVPLSKSGYWNRVYINLLHKNYQDLTSDNYAYFILRNTETNQIESSLEILFRDCWVKPPATSPSSDKVLKAKSGVIGSVYTDEKFRGRGNINKMFKSLDLELKSKYLTGEYDVSLLYSEIGEYYSKYGYESSNVPVWQFKPHISQVEDIHINGKFIENRTQLFPLIEDHKSNLLKSMQSTSSNESAIFALVPSVEAFDWFFNRARIAYWDLKCPQSPIPHGFQDPKSLNSNEPYDTDLKYGYYATIDGKLQYIIWTVEMGSNELSVLLLHATSEPAFKFFVSKALSYAADMDLEVVKLWDVDTDLENKDLILSQMNGNLKQENSSLSALKWGSNSNNTPITWKDNSKWCWF